jgi:hypothetical protein
MFWRLAIASLAVIWFLGEVKAVSLAGLNPRNGLISAY